MAGERLDALGHFAGLVSLDIHLGYLHLLSGELDLAIERCDAGPGPPGREPASAGRAATCWSSRPWPCSSAAQDEASAAAARSSLAMKHELGDIVGTAYCLEMLAHARAGSSACERTAWLLGAADALWDRAGTRLGGTAIMEELHPQAVKAAQDALGEERYAALFRDGAAQPLDRVVGLAAADDDELPAVPDPPGPLTEREREIAVLVAEGMSNRRDRAAARPSPSARSTRIRAHLRQAGHLLPRPARHLAGPGSRPRLAGPRVAPSPRPPGPPAPWSACRATRRTPR